MNGLIVAGRQIYMFGQEAKNSSNFFVKRPICFKINTFDKTFILKTCTCQLSVLLKAFSAGERKYHVFHENGLLIVS